MKPIIQFFNFLRRILSQFLTQSTFHGFKYLLSGYEGLFWLLLLSFNAYLILVNITSYISEVSNNPTETTVSLIPRGSVPFPGIIIDRGSDRCDEQILNYK